jgi:hypothetical protein
MYELIWHTLIFCYILVDLVISLFFLIYMIIIEIFKFIKNKIVYKGFENYKKYL